MAAPIGNKNALANEGGRPPIYNHENPEDILLLENKCNEYFQYIKGEYEKIINPDDPEDITIKTIRDSESPTITGLTLFLGFESKSTLYDYAKKIEFSYYIKRAITKIEQYHEFRVSDGDKCVGNIFVLKNMGWHDSVKTDVTTQGEKINTTPTIVFKKYTPDGD